MATIRPGQAKIKAIVVSEKDLLGNCGRLGLSDRTAA